MDKQMGPLPWIPPDWLPLATEVGGVTWFEPIGLGLGNYPAVTYGQPYWEEYRRRDATDMGRRLTQARIAFVKRYNAGSDMIDIGVGGCRFVKEAGCTGFRINPLAIEWLKSRGVWRSPLHTACSTMTFWDSLEHAIEWGQVLGACRHWAFVSTPIYLGLYDCVRSKHYKPGEHMLYFTNNGLKWFMSQHGFELAGFDNFETKLGREAIGTYAFERRKRGPE